MERGAKKSKKKVPLEPREELIIPKEARTLLRECFKKSSLYSLVPFDIWKVVVARAALRSIGKVAQLSRGFRELVRQLRRSDIRMALGYRKAGQIPLAKQCITSCAEHGNARAMLLLGIACTDGGWGYKGDNERRHYWLKKAAEAGEATGMALYARYLKFRSNEVTMWTRKALSSENRIAIELCQLFNLGTIVITTRAFFLKIAAKNGDEVAQYWLGVHYEQKGDKESAFRWYFQAAEQGLAPAQYAVYYLYKHAYQFEGIPTAVEWKRKAMQQGCYNHYTNY